MRHFSSLETTETKLYHESTKFGVDVGLFKAQIKFSISVAFDLTDNLSVLQESLAREKVSSTLRDSLSTGIRHFSISEPLVGPSPFSVSIINKSAGNRRSFPSTSQWVSGQYVQKPLSLLSAPQFWFLSTEKKNLCEYAYFSSPHFETELQRRQILLFMPTLRCAKK